MSARDNQFGYAIIVAIVAGLFGAAAGWYSPLPLLMDEPGRSFVRIFSLGVGATFAFIIGGGLAARHASDHFR
jgi:hypothetical protein